MSSELRDIWSAAGGNTPQHWDFVRFEELLADPKAISVGVMYPGKHEESGVPLIKVSDVKNGAVVGKPEFCISATVDEEYRRTRLTGSELLITLVGNPGDCAVANETMAGWNAARALAVVRFKDPNIRPWVRYVLLGHTAKHLMNSRLNTTVQKTLNLKDIRSLPIPIAPLNERQTIVGIASSLENKINQNYQINQTLEQMAQAIFKSWFVDFEPVKAKIAALEAGGNEEDTNLAAMQVISGKTLPELQQLKTENPDHYQQLLSTAQHFPAAMQDSELGEIPAGWNKGTLASIAEFSDKRISTETLTLSNYVSTENMLENKAGVREASSLATSATVPSFEPGHILISNIRPYFKKIWLANTYGGRSPDVLGFQAKLPDTDEYLYNYLYQDAFFEYMMLTSKGAKMPRGDKQAIMQLPLVVPPTKMMQYFSGTVKKFYVLICKQSEQSELYSRMRDILLPKLLSGELSVANLNQTELSK